MTQKLFEDFLDTEQSDVMTVTNDGTLPDTTQFDEQFIITYDYTKLFDKHNTRRDTAVMLRDTIAVCENCPQIISYSRPREDMLENTEAQISFGVKQQFHNCNEILRFVMQLLCRVVRIKNSACDICYVKNDSHKIYSIFRPFEIQSFLLKKKNSTKNEWKYLVRFCQAILGNCNVVYQLRNITGFRDDVDFRIQVLNYIKQLQDGYISFMNNTNIPDVEGLTLNLNKIKEQFGNEDCLFFKHNVIGESIQNYYQVNSYNIDSLLGKYHTIESATTGAVTEGLSISQKYLYLYLGVHPMENIILDEAETDWSIGTLHYALVIFFSSRQNAEDVLKMITD